jgi:hypothetical protein
MSNPQNILNQARELGAAEHLAYAGAVTPQQAYALLQADPGIKLVDVRTKAERDWVGQVKIDPAQHAAIEWNTYPQGTFRRAFAARGESGNRTRLRQLFRYPAGLRRQ